MGRDPRYVPPGSLVEVTTRTVQGRFLLRPSRELCEITLGILGRATERYDVDICAYVFLSNHSHLLLSPADAQQQALFMGYLNGNLAKEAGRLHDWPEKFWGRRYTDILTSDEPEAQIARLQYLLEHGCKENLVRKPGLWPGANSVQALLDGKPVTGVWFDRTRQWRARKSRQGTDKYEFTTKHTFSLAPLPCWQHKTPVERQKLAAEMVRSIERKTRQRLEQDNQTPIGIHRILHQDPHNKPDPPDRRPAPRFHAASREVRMRLLAAYREFLNTFRQAAQDLKDGFQNPRFPDGCFPPGLPFVRAKPPPLATAPIY